MMIEQGRTSVRVEQQKASPGLMTAVMRAVTPTGPRVLRIGVFVDARIVEERIVPRQGAVSVGTSEKATFVVKGGAALHRLIERAGDGYVLHLAPGITGRVATSAGAVDLGTCGARTLPLDEQARGRIVVGDTTLLFQFVVPPPPQARPQLPLAVKQGLLAQIDWALTVIAAFSFLLHFGLVGGMYSDWGDTVVNDDLTVGISHLVVPPAAPTVVETSETPAASATANTQPTPSSPATSRPAPVSTNRPSPQPPSQPDPSTVSGLVNDLARLHVEAVGSTRGGPNLTAVLTTPDSAPVDLNALWNRETRIDNRSSSLGLPPGQSAPIEPGRRDLPVGTTPDVGTAVAIKKVVPVDVHEDPPVLSGSVANAEAVIRSQIHPGARRCYQSGIDSDPEQSGKLMVLIRIGPSGEVQSATLQSNTGLSPRVAMCVLGVARNAKFDQPGPSGASVLVPFSFLKQGR
jgi:hypothetical protein